MADLEQEVRRWTLYAENGVLMANRITPTWGGGGLVVAPLAELEESEALCAVLRAHVNAREAEHEALKAKFDRLVTQSWVVVHTQGKLSAIEGLHSILRTIDG